MVFNPFSHFVVPSELLVAAAVTVLPILGSFVGGPNHPLTSLLGLAVAGVVIATMAKHKGI
jgi:hypothetical protein